MFQGDWIPVISFCVIYVGYQCILLNDCWMITNIHQQYPKRLSIVTLIYHIIYWRTYSHPPSVIINTLAVDYLAISFMSNDAKSSLPWFIVVFFYHFIFLPRVWVLPLIMITDYIWSTLLSILTPPLSSLSLNIKTEQTFGKWSIRTQSRITKLGVINFLVVWFHLVHSSVCVPTWWSKSSSGFICAYGICIGFIDIVPSIGHAKLNSFVV